MTYASSLALGRKSGTPLRNQNGVAYRTREHALGPISNTIILIVLACLLGLLYLTQVTKTNAYGYEISSLQDRQAQLKEEHSELEVAAARLQAADRVQNSEVAQGLVSAAPKDVVQ